MKRLLILLIGGLFWLTASTVTVPAVVPRTMLPKSRSSVATSDSGRRITALPCPFWVEAAAGVPARMKPSAPINGSAPVRVSLVIRRG